MKYSTGTKLFLEHHMGTVVDPNDERFTKRPVIPGDICVIWENGLQSTYDHWWLDANTNIEPTPATQPKEEK